LSQTNSTHASRFLLIISVRIEIECLFGCDYKEDVFLFQTVHHKKKSKIRLATGFVQMGHIYIHKDDINHIYIYISLYFDYVPHVTCLNELSIIFSNSKGSNRVGFQTTEVLHKKFTQQLQRFSVRQRRMGIPRRKPQVPPKAYLPPNQGKGRAQ